MRTIVEIAKSISQHRNEEERLGKRNIGVARAECIISSATMTARDYLLWLTNASNNPMQLFTSELTISKNSKVAGAIIQGVTGRHKYDGPGGRIYTRERCGGVGRRAVSLRPLPRPHKEIPAP